MTGQPSIITTGMAEATLRDLMEDMVSAQIEAEAFPAYDDNPALHDRIEALDRDGRRLRKSINEATGGGVAPAELDRANTLLRVQIRAEREAAERRAVVLGEAIRNLEQAAPNLRGKALDGYHVAIEAIRDMKEGRW